MIGCAKEAPSEHTGAAAQSLSEACPGPVSKPEHGKACTKMGCESGFSIVFQPKAPWPQGPYRFQFEIDGRTLTCTGSLPLKSCAERNVICDGGDVTIAESGCDLPAASHSFWSASFQGFPREVSVTAYLDGSQIGTLQHKPAYQRNQPNGPGCDPVCCSASSELTLNLPQK